MQRPIDVEESREVRLHQKLLIGLVEIEVDDGIAVLGDISASNDPRHAYTF